MKRTVRPRLARVHDTDQLLFFSFELAVPLMGHGDLKLHVRFDLLPGQILQVLVSYHKNILSHHPIYLLPRGNVVNSHYYHTQ